MLGFPVEVTAVNHNTTHSHGMTVHVLGGRVGHDVCAEFEGAAENRGGESVVDDQRHAVLVSQVGEALQVKNLAGGVSHSFTEDALGVGAESHLDFFVGSVLVDEGAFDAQLLHGNAEEVAGTAVDCGSRNEVVTGFADVEHGVEVCSLTGRGEHGTYATFQLSDLGGNSVVGGVLETGVEVAGFLQVEQVSHLGGSVVLESGALVDGEHAGFALLGGPTGLNTQCFEICHIFLFMLNALIASATCRAI